MITRDRELLELLRDEPDLLAIVDAAHETMHTPRDPKRRAYAGAGAILGVAAILAITFLALGDTIGTHDQFDQRALAAVGSGAVVHVQIASQTDSSEIITIKTGSARPEPLISDYWFDVSQHRLRAIIRRGNLIVADTTETIRGGTSRTGPVLEASSRDALVDPTIVALVTDYRSALRGRRTGSSSGAAQVDGKHIRWVPLAGDRGVSVAVDLTTYRPIALVARGTSLGSSVQRRITSFATVAASAADRDQQGLLLAASSVGRAIDLRSIAASQLRLLVDPSAVWLGTSIASIPLARIVLQRLTTDRTPAVGRGATLLYGTTEGSDIDRSQPFVVVREAGFPAPAYRFLPQRSSISPTPGRGQLRLEQEPRADRRTSSTWIAQLTRDRGLYITIEASSRALALRAARAIRPARISS